jgi:hypothetical protein
MWPHTMADVNTMLSALDETLGELTRVHEQGRLQDEAGSQQAGTGFARLA